MTKKTLSGGAVSEEHVAEVMQLHYAGGLSLRAISRKLGLSRNTVRNHVARLYAKIGVNRRSAAVIWGRERGMGRRPG